MDMKIQNKKYVIPAEAGIQQVIESYIPNKPLDYEIHPCISSFGPAFGCSY
jgi:hypothetical protein